MKTSLKWVRKEPPKSKKPKGPKQDKPKVKHPKTHINQINEDQTQREILTATREKQQITHKGIPIRITADFSTDILQVRREWQDILEDETEKPTT